MVNSVGLVYTLSPSRSDFSTPDDSSVQAREAPLHHVHARVRIIDTVAHVSLQQHYSNPEKNTPIQAIYRFPLHQGAAIHAFEAVINETKRIVGKVKESEQARQVYQEAVARGKVASLLEQVLPDVYQASVGNIPVGGRVTVNISYVCEIQHDAESDQIRFVLPTAIAPRYGAPPAFPTTSSSSTIPASSYAASSRESFLTIDVSCQMGNVISSVESPSHLITMHLGKDMKEEELSAAFDPSKACVEFTSKDVPLTKDFVLVIKSKDLDKPRCFIESHPAAETSCMMLTLVPRFALNDIPSELIFLVDRSGSMSGSRINQTRQALQLFLRSIPPKNYFLNIVGFGSSYQFLFPDKSVEYNQTNLAHALKHAEGMDADLGGTEIYNALQAVFKARRRDMPTQVFVLTDGEVWDVERVLDLIRTNVGDDREDESEGNGIKPYPPSFVRVFSMGIGNNVSHQLVEGMARVGKGFAQFVVESERMEKKIIRQLKSALMPPMTNYEITWVPGDGDGEARDQDHPSKPTPQTTNTVDKGSPSTSDHKDTFPPDYAEATAESAPGTPVDNSKPKPVISLFNENPNPTPPPALPVPPMPQISRDFQPAPYEVPPLYPGSRFVVFCIVKNSALAQSNDGIPEHVVIRGQTPDGPVELKVPVKKLSNPFAKTMTPDKVNPNANIPSQVLLHTLAARKLIQDLEEERSHLHAYLKKDPSLLHQSEHTVHSIVKAETIRLGLEFNLASKYTSFVAVDDDEEKRIMKDQEETEKSDISPTIIQTQTAPLPTTEDTAGYVPCLYDPSAALSLYDPSAMMHLVESSSGTLTYRTREFRKSKKSVRSVGLPRISLPRLSRRSSGMIAEASPASSSSVGSRSWVGNAWKGLMGGGGKGGAPSSVGVGDQASKDKKRRSLFGIPWRGSNSSKEEIMNSEGGPDLVADAGVARAAGPAIPAGDLDGDVGVVDAVVARVPGTSPSTDKLHSLIQLQNWDGSFPLSAQLCTIIAPTHNLTTLESLLADIFTTTSTEQNQKEFWEKCTKEEKNEVESIWATCLAIVFCRQKLGHLKEEWELVMGKAEGFVKGWGGIGGKVSVEVVEGLWKKAEEVV